MLLRPCHVDVKINKNGANSPSKTTLKSTSQLASILQPTWLHFGRVLASKLEPSWDKKPPKPDVKTNQKNNRFLEGLWIDFWSILGSMLEGLGRFFCGFFAFFWLLVGSPGQDGSKTSPRRRRDRF